MGVRFACHECGRRLNIKSELAGRRGKCPSCGVRFRIPPEDAEFSIPLETATETPTETASVEQPQHAEPEPQVQEAPVQETPVQETPVQEAPSEAIPQWQPVEPDNDQQVVESDRQPSDESAPRRFALLDEDPDAQWYVRPKSGGQYGPASVELLYEWIEQGRVSSAALLWRDGWAQWRNAHDALPELTAPAAAPVPAIDTSTPPAPTEVAASPANRPVFVTDSPIGNDLSGDTAPGMARSQRKGRRVTMISLLLAVSVLLVFALVVVIIKST